MKVAICGAGLIGITTAHALAREGIETVVIDRAPAMAEGGASYANAGSVTVSRSGPWASPATLIKALKWLGRADAPLLFRPRLDLAQWQWSMAFVAASFSRDRAERRAAMVGLATLSRDILLDMETVTAPSYQTLRTGLLTLYRDIAEFTAASADCQTLARLGVSALPLSVEQCLETEPGLAAMREPCAGGIFAPDDVAGDSLAFTRALGQDFLRLGGTFRPDSTVQRIEIANGKVCGLRLTSGDVIAADVVVMAAGSDSRTLLAPLGLSPRLYPVKGYSITIPGPTGTLPVHTISEDSRKVFLTPLGDRLRVAGVAEFAGFDKSLDQRRIDGLKKVVTDLFPALDTSGDCAAWTGLRGMTPDGPPVLGPTKVPGLFVNFGHGSLGWTLSCGSARIVADLIVGRKPSLPLDHLLAKGRI